LLSSFTLTNASAPKQSGTARRGSRRQFYTLLCLNTAVLQPQFNSYHCSAWNELAPTTEAIYQHYQQNVIAMVRGNHPENAHCQQNEGLTAPTADGYNRKGQHPNPTNWYTPGRGLAAQSVNRYSASFENAQFLGGFWGSPCAFSKQPQFNCRSVIYTKGTSYGDTSQKPQVDPGLR
jgi:hypothetical protein